MICSRVNILLFVVVYLSLMVFNISTFFDIESSLSEVVIACWLLVRLNVNVDFQYIIWGRHYSKSAQNGFIGMRILRILTVLHTPTLAWNALSYHRVCATWLLLPPHAQLDKVTFGLHNTCGPPFRSQSCFDEIHSAVLGRVAPL